MVVVLSLWRWRILGVVVQITADKQSIPYVVHLEHSGALPVRMPPGVALWPYGKRNAQALELPDGYDWPENDMANCVNPSLLKGVQDPSLKQLMLPPSKRPQCVLIVATS